MRAGAEGKRRQVGARGLDDLGRRRARGLEDLAEVLELQGKTRRQKGFERCHGPDAEEEEDLTICSA